MSLTPLNLEITYYNNTEEWTRQNSGTSDHSN